MKFLPRALVAFHRSPIHWHEHPFAKELMRLEGNDGRFRGPGASCAGTLRYLRPGRGIPNAKSTIAATVAATRQQLAPSSIKTSQIDAVVKREEESCRHLRDSMPLHSRFPRSLFRARNPSSPAAHSSSYPLSWIVLVQPPCVRPFLVRSYKCLYYTIKSKRRRFLQSREPFVETTWL